MAARFILVLCASALFVQSALAQYVSSGSYVAGNSVVDNSIIIGGYGSGVPVSIGNGYGLGNSVVGSGYGLGSSVVGSGYGLGSSVVGSGFGLGSGVVSGGYGLGSVGVSSGALGLAGSNVVVGGIGGLNVAPSGPLVVTAISPIGPSGLAVASEIVLEGLLTVSGQLPFLSAVAFEGALPTAGSGVATCGCGSGNVGIVSEGFPANYGGIGIGSGIGGIYY